VVRSTRRTAAAPKNTTDDLADRLRTALPGEGISEKKMFGGTGFMLDGNMVAGTFRGGLLVRIGKERHDEALRRPGAGPMLMRGRPIAGYVLIDGETLSDPSIREWSQLALSYVRTLPPKPVKPKMSRKKEGTK
jgi:TfoX/Sxy family transcriptional regulator of competence genes